MAFDNIRHALHYIDAHLDEPLTVERVAAAGHFSTFYFHRMFTAVAGQSLAAYIRQRRVDKACGLIADSQEPLLKIGLLCGFGSHQAFHRAFVREMGMAPGAYRQKGLHPVIETTEERIIRFTNRMKGGMIVKPRIIRRGIMRIAGVTGDGTQTAAVWQAFEDLLKDYGLPERESDDGYEVRLHKDGQCRVHVGHLLPKNIQPHSTFTIVELPASTYAAFDVYVSRGYDSENNAMEEWLATNPEGYRVHLLNGQDFVVEYYDERFKGDEAGSIVEIWVPVVKG